MKKLPINSTGRKDGCRDKGMRRGRGRGNSSVFLLNPLFVMIPLGKSSILEREGKEEEERGQRGSDLINEIKCRSLKFVVLR